jgi:ABC-type multidrug transport system fused ATPase/permease subunit
MLIEFISHSNVSFRYPNSTNYSLKNLSFRLEKGQLCVIVGSNGSGEYCVSLALWVLTKTSGKSTLLNLLLRIYDPTEGKILINGRDIRSLRVADLRRTIAVLFQDFSLFPLTVSLAHRCHCVLYDSQ